MDVFPILETKQTINFFWFEMNKLCVDRGMQYMQHCSSTIQ